MTYTVITDDTFEIISRKVYGEEGGASLIANSNPGVSTLTVGIVINIPDRPDAPQDTPGGVPSVSENEVALNIDGKRFRFWSTMKITRSIDSMSVIGFTAPFEVDNQAFRDTFRPFSFQRLTVLVGGEPLFTGTMLTAIPTVGVDRKSVAVNGYSLPGVLRDCPLPSSAFPLEFNGQGLRDIARSAVSHFGLSVEFSAQQGPVFERVAADPVKKVQQFLIDLADQRNFVVSSTPEGRVLFWRSVTPGNPVARLEQGSPPILTILPQFDPQKYYSHITGLAPAFLGVEGSKYTVKNPRLEGVIRPFTFKGEDTTDGDIKEATEAKAGYMFGGAVAYTVTLATWRDPQGKLWEENTTITLLAPGAMIYSEYEFLIRSVTLSRDENSDIAELSLVVPGVFDGQIPETMPWD